MAYNETVNININANTTDAAQDVEKLERNIATLDGTINVVGGSIEVLAGSLALTGAVTEEQAERFQSAAVGAIALADGSKRIIEGYKTLKKDTKVLTALQRVYNTVLKSNPIFLLVSVLAAVAVGYALFSKRQKESADAAEEEAKEQAKVTAELEKQKKLRNDTARVGDTLLKNKERNIIKPLERELALLKAQGASRQEIFEKEQEILNEQIDIYDSLAITYSNDDKLSRELAEKKADAQNKLKILRIENARAIGEAEMARIKAVEEAEEKAFQKFKTDYEKRKELEKKEFDERLARDRERYASAVNTANQINQTEQKILDSRIEIGQIGVEAFQEGLNAIFGESKGLAKAQVLIDAAQAAVGIIRSGTDPRNAEALVFPNAWMAANLAFLAATTATSLQSINSASPGSTGGGTDYGGGVPSLGGNTGGVPQIPGFGTSGVTSLNAVVLSGDVTSAQAQDAAIRNRRRFGRGG